jgi:type II secretory pathway predicted ATPase ExeA
MEALHPMYLNVSPYLELLEGIPVALQVNEGIIKLTGRDGVGKSALCQALSALLAGRGLHVIYFPTAPATVDILEALIRARFGLESGLNFTKQLTRHLQEQSGAQRQLYVIFDNAQDIDEPVFNSIRMLCNIQDEHQALVKPIICGSVALDRKLTAVNYRSVSQYLSQSFTLSPMTIEQLKNFYWAYWQQQGLQVQPPGPTVVNNLFKESQGFPGPVLARLGHAYQRVLDRRQGRGTDQTLVKPMATTRSALRTWLALGLGCVLIGVGAGLVYVVERVDLDVAAVVQQVAPAPAPAATAPAPEPVVVDVVVEPAVVAEPEQAQVPVDEPAAASATEIASESVVEPEQVSENDVVAEGELVAESEPAAASEVIAEDPTDLATESIVASEPEVPDSLAAADALLATWTSAWQAKDIETYLAQYHAEFEPATAATRLVWAAQRRDSINRAVDIRISYDSVEIVAEDDSSLTLQFWLHYSASSYADDTLKELVLLKSADGLLIRSERNLLVEQPQ